MTVTKFLTLGLLILGAALGFAIIGWQRNFGEKALLERKIQEQEDLKTRMGLEKDKAETGAKLVVAKNQQAELLAQARKVAASFEKLISDLAEVNTSATLLRTNETGQAAAAHHDLVVQARRLYESEMKDLPTTREAIERLESARRIEQQLADAQGTAFEPSVELAANLQSAAAWGDMARQAITRVQIHLTGIGKEAKIKYNPNPITAKSPTLDEGMQKLAAIEVAAYESKIAESQAAGKSQAADIVAQAEAKRIVEEANLKAQQILDEAKAKAAVQERERQLRAANEVVTNAVVKTQVETKLNEAERIALRQRASDPAVKIKLAPYLTPGRYVPYISGRREPLTIDLKPMSFSKLSGIGALTPTERGLRAFVEVGMDPKNDRPHLPGEFKMTRWYQNGSSLATAAELQKLMVELGPTLVEMGLLEP